MKKKIFIAAAVIISSHAHGQKTSTLVSDSVSSLAELVVTATRFPTKQSSTGKMVTVITKEQIENAGTKSLANLLNEQAGITINGVFQTAGSAQTLYTRGAASGRTLLLLDGIPVLDPSMINNEYDLNLFSLSQVERIEICSGAQSTLYGSDAIGGVINIITKSNTIQKPISIGANTVWGNKNTQQHNLSLNGHKGKWTYSTRFAKMTTDGFSSAEDTTGKMQFDRDGYDGHSFLASVQYQLNPHWQLNSFLQQSKYAAGIDAGIFSDDRDYSIRNSGLQTGGNIRFTKNRLQLVGSYQYGAVKRSYLNDSLHQTGFTKYEDNQYRSRTQFTELYGHMDIAQWLSLTAGTEYRWGTYYQKYFSVSAFGPYEPPTFDSSLVQQSIYASLFFNLLQEKLHIEIGGRVNHHAIYGSHSTYNINPTYQINQQWRVFASISSGFKAPSIYQVYDQYSGNSNLQPERAVNYELGFQSSAKKINTRLLYFSRDIKDGIDYNYTDYTYFNFIKQAVKGIEASIRYSPVEKIQCSINYTYLTGKEYTQSRKSFADTMYTHLLRRPKCNVNVQFGYQMNQQLGISIQGKYVAGRYDVGGYKKDDLWMADYFIAGLTAAYKLNNHVKCTIDIQNLFNEKFTEIRGYTTIPFLINGGVSFNW